MSGLIPKNAGGDADELRSVRERSYTKIMLRDVITEASVGLHPWEKYPEKPSRLIVNVEVFSFSEKKRAEPEGAFINYDPIRDFIRTWPGRPHVLLLETLVDELVELCFQNELSDAVRVSVVKPDIYNEVSAAGVEVYRERKDQSVSNLG